MVAYGPAHETTRRLIEILTADSTLHALLFPSWKPTPVSANDTRIYGSHQSMYDPRILAVLPRVIVETRQHNFDAEQDSEVPAAPVDVWFHCITPKDQYDHAEAMDARIRTIIGSTVLTSSRIIGSTLTETATNRRVVVETAFNDAWRITSAFNAPNVGVLAT